MWQFCSTSQSTLPSLTMYYLVHLQLAFKRPFCPLTLLCNALGQWSGSILSATILQSGTPHTAIDQSTWQESVAAHYHYWARQGKSQMPTMTSHIVCAIHSKIWFELQISPPSRCMNITMRSSSGRKGPSGWLTKTTRSKQATQGKLTRRALTSCVHGQLGLTSKAQTNRQMAQVCWRTWAMDSSMPGL